MNVNASLFRSLASCTLILVAGVAASEARAGVDVSIAAEIRLGHAAPPPPPAVVVIEEAGPAGPPPWAPAHGFRRNRVYYYYPAAGVYYRPTDRMWFYLDGGSWRVGVVLPDAISIDFGRSVRLTMETDEPQRFHREVVTYYPAAYFGTKVRLRDDPDPRTPNARRGASPGSRPDHQGGPADERGRGQGKGRGNKP